MVQAPQMIRNYQRDITDAERQLLLPHTPGLWKRLESFVLKWIFIFMLSFIPLILCAEIFDLKLMDNIPVIMLWLVTTILITLSFAWREEMSWKKSLLYQDLERGKVNVTECRPVNAIQIEEDGNNGTAFFLDIEDGKTLFLKGQYLNRGQFSFPSTDFEIIKAPRSGIIVDLIIKGDYLPPQDVRKPYTRDDYLDGKVPFDGDIIEKPISEVLD